MTVVKGIFSCLILVFCQPVLWAGGLDRLLFESSGKRISVSEFQTENQAIVVHPKLFQSEATWKLVLPPWLLETDVLPSIQWAFNLWNMEENISMNFVYAGLRLDKSIPYTTIDAFGNQAIEGDFFISFDPPAEVIFEDGVVSKTVEYVIPDLVTGQGEVRWAGIFFNPAYIINYDYNLVSVLAHELGRIMGLAPSSQRSAILYPTRPAIESSLPKLSEDDIYWAASLYPVADFLPSVGKVSGKVINGDTGKGLVGASVSLLSLADRERFSTTLEKNLTRQSSLSSKDGQFEFSAVPPGEYLVLVESFNDISLAPELLDEWMRVFHDSNYFPIEFYDGAGRESNQESFYGFSAQSVFLAATIVVEAAGETNNIVVVTNSADSSKTKIEAPGSNHEKLSAVTVKMGAISYSDLNLKDVSASAGAGGCQLGRSDLSDRSSLLWIFFALTALFLIRWDQRARWCRSGCRKP